MVKGKKKKLTPPAFDPRPPFVAPTTSKSYLPRPLAMAVAFRSATRIASFFGAVEGDAAGSGTRGRTPNVAGGGGSLCRLRSLSSFPPSSLF
jgi:hypothetical protein